MSQRNTVVRSLHDLGLAAWFGGSLAGAVGFNGAAADVPDEKLRLRVANAAWARWTPVNLAGITAHLVGGAGILIEPRPRRDAAGRGRLDHREDRADRRRAGRHRLQPCAGQ